MNFLETSQGKKLLTGYLDKFSGKSSLKVYKSEIVRFFRFYQGGLEKLTKTDVDAYADSLSDRGQVQIMRKISILAGFLTYSEAEISSFSSPITKNFKAVIKNKKRSDSSFQTGFDKWVDELRATRKPNTVKTYSLQVRLFFEWVRKSPADLLPDDFRQYMAYLKDDEGLSVTTVWSRFISINSFLKFLVSDSFTNPLNIKSLRFPKLPKGQGYNNVLTNDEVGSLLNQPDRSTLIGKRDYFILLLMLQWGLRANEVCRFSYGWIEPDVVDTERVPSQKAWIKDRKGRMPDTDIYLNGELFDLWQEWRSVTGIDWTPGTKIFPGFRYDRAQKALLINRKQVAEKRPLRTMTIFNIVEKYIKQAGIVSRGRVLSPHSLRHTCLTPLARIQWIAGHSDIRTTNIYTHHRQSHDDNTGFVSLYDF
ncbi:MAG: tyrosine-type recombinase/integrase [Desulfobacteraceae bacterium]|nr:tyrosine-type recombinase/integrase [Desulfobacteraceae bacterium]